MFTTIEQFRKSFDPFAIGFDDTIDMMLKSAEYAQKATGYPPYNIKKVKDDKYVIELAVAGFAKSDIEIQLQGNKLVIQGQTKDEDAEYLYKGIANRGFSREFTLADKVEIKDAEIVNGMLKVWLSSLVQTQDAIKKIAIK